MERIRRIDEFCPAGMQIKSPGGLSFNPQHISAIEAYGEEEPRLVMRFVGGGSTTVLFHRNVDGGPPDVYGLARRIREMATDQ